MATLHRKTTATKTVQACQAAIIISSLLQNSEIYIVIS